MYIQLACFSGWFGRIFQRILSAKGGARRCDKQTYDWLGNTKLVKTDKWEKSMIKQWHCTVQSDSLWTRADYVYFRYFYPMDYYNFIRNIYLFAHLRCIFIMMEYFYYTWAWRTDITNAYYYVSTVKLPAVFFFIFPYFSSVRICAFRL